MNDNLIQCKHCGSSLAYEEIKDGVSYEVQCVSCGFFTNNSLLEGTEELKVYLESIPTIYAELKFIDEDGLCWIPMYKDIYGKGVIAINGISKDRYMWSFIPYVPLLDTDADKDMWINSDGTYPEWKLDFTKQEHFSKHDFLLALHKLGFFNELQTITND